MNNLILPNIQAPNACGYIACRAAIAIHESNNWFAEALLDKVTDDNLIPLYNSILNVPTDDGQFLTDNQLLKILHATCNDQSGVYWLDSIPPFNLFMQSIQQHTRQQLQRNKRLHIAIVNTTSQTQLNNIITGDHWIMVAYELF